MQILLPKGKVGFRLAKDEDQTFLRDLFAAGREWEFAVTNWTAEDKRDFLDRQFAAKEQSYKLMFPKAVYHVIQMDDADIGRLTIERQDHCLKIIEFAITPSYQRRGIGTDILRSLLNEAQGGKVPVRISVEKGNPAMALYARHDFKVVEDLQTHFALEWRPFTGAREI